MNQLLFKCSIIVDHHAVKKNNRTILLNRKTGRPFIGKSKELEVAESILLRKLIIQKMQNKIFEPINYDIQVKFTFHFKNYFTKKGERNKKLPDLSNLYQLPEDCLQEAHIIENDSLIQSHDGSRIKPGKENILEIEIYKFNDMENI